MGYIFVFCFVMFSFSHLSLRAKSQRPGPPPARPQGAPPKPRRSLPPRVTPGPLTPRVHQKPASHKGMEPGPNMVAPHLEEARVTRPGGSWAFLLLPLHLQPQKHLPHQRLRKVPVFYGWTSTAHDR